MNKKILSLVVSLAMVLGSLSMAFALPTDVVGTDVEQAVERLVGLGVLTGYPDGTFKPNNNITRAEFAAAVSRAKGLEALVNSSQGNTIFGDVLAGHWASGYINIAEQHDLIKGMGMVNGINTFGPELNITYEQAVTLVVRALGFESKAENNGGYPNGHLLVASQEGLLQNINGTVGSLATRGLVAQLTYNALEVPNMIKVGSNWIKSGTQGTDEIYLFNELRLINKAAASGDWSSIDLSSFQELGILGINASNLGSLKDILETLASGVNQDWLPSDIQGVLDNFVAGKKVISANAISATEVEIKFNTKLDPADAVTNPLYKVSISGVTFVGTPDLSDDGKILTLTASAAINVNNAALIVEPIQTEENPTELTDRYTSSFSYKDLVKASVKAITSKTNSNVASTVNVEFNEPIQSLGTVKINGVVKGASGFVAGDKEANFTGLSLNASQSHTIQIIGLLDRASNTSDIINESFDVEVDTVLPTVSLSASQDKDYVIVLEFDKAITTATATALLVNGVVKNETLNNQASGTAVAINPVNGLSKKYELAVTTPFSSLSTRNLTVVIPSGLKDVLGNEVANTTKTVTLTKDVVKPEIELVRFIKDPNDNVVSLILSTDSTLAAKASVNPPILKNNLTIMDSDGVLVDSSLWLGGLSQNPITAGDKKITLSFATPGKLSGDYDITFAAGLGTDEADTPNNLKSKNVIVDFGDITTTSTFTILPVDVSSGGSNIYDINFGAAVRGGNVNGSATDLANYTLNGSLLPSGTTATLNPTKDIAKITLPAESIAVSDIGAVFTINNVERLTGETIVPFTTTVATVDNVKPVMDFAVLTNDNRLVVGFSEALAAIPAAGDFTIKINNKAITATPAFVAGTGSDAGKYVVDLNALVLNDGSQTYIDIDLDGSYLAANDIFVKTEAIQSAFSMKTSSVVSSVTIEVVAGATTDLAGNTLKLGSLISTK